MYKKIVVTKPEGKGPLGGPRHRGATNEKCTKKIVVTKPEGKRPLGGPRHRWGILLKLVPSEQSIYIFI